MSDNEQTTLISRLDEVIAEMLTESTGTHFLDSGGAYGRAWQRNQAAVAMTGMTPAEFFRAQPEAWFDWPSVDPHPNHRKPGEVCHASLSPTVHVFHFLTRALSDYHEDGDKAFNEFAELPENQEEGWLALMEEFPRWWAAKKAADEWNKGREPGEGEMTVEDVLEHGNFTEPSGIYGEGQPFVVNTYNGEDAVSQTLQYAYWGDDDGIYVLLQIHGGADVRGGYTKPRLFSVDRYDDTGILDNARAYCSCDNPECELGRWYTDDAYNWYNDDTQTKLNDLPAREGTWVEAAFLCQDSGLLGDDELPTVIVDQRGQYPPDETIVFCPYCGSGKIEPFIY